PVILHPEATPHTVTPLPGSAQMRVQQLVPLEQGIPSWMHPPGGKMQNPALPSFVLHSLLQQSKSP
ncbi:MAG TPA: hypothetical protein VE782_15565, partial [Myxococcaceae bacterium]|nr:hypothetical protein [Myxococcaceae bacterium]